MTEPNVEMSQDVHGRACVQLRLTEHRNAGQAVLTPKQAKALAVELIRVAADAAYRNANSRAPGLR